MTTLAINPSPNVARQIYDFPVALRPVYDEDGTVIPHAKSVKRLDTRQSLAVVSNRYNLIPHQKMVDAFTPFAERLGNHTTRFHQERDGARVIMEQTFNDVTFRIPQAHRIFGRSSDRSVGDVVALRTYGINSYNTTTPLTLRVGCLVLRCLNGATTMQSFFGLNVRHVGSGEPLINLPTPESVLASFEQTSNTWQEWADTVLTSRQKEELEVDLLHFGVTNKRMLKQEEDRFAFVETLWDFYNAATHIITHESRRIQETTRLSRYDRLNMLMNSFVNPEREEAPVDDLSI